MIDLYKVLPKTAVFEFLKEKGYEFSAFETVTLLTRLKPQKAIGEYHSMLIDICMNSTDSNDELSNNPEDAIFISLVEECIKDQQKLMEELFKEDGGVYSWQAYSKDIGGYFYSLDKVFTAYKDCVNHALEMLSDNNIDLIEVSKIYPTSNKFEGKAIYAALDIEGKLLSISLRRDAFDTKENLRDFLAKNEISVPHPFKKGDLVSAITRSMGLEQAIYVVSDVLENGIIEIIGAGPKNGRLHQRRVPAYYFDKWDGLEEDKSIRPLVYISNYLKGKMALNELFDNFLIIENQL